MDSPDAEAVNGFAGYAAVTSRRDELWNTITHFFGLLLVIGATPVLITVASLYGNVREIVTFSVYSASLIVTYLISTVYHYVKPGQLKHILRHADHISIYLLIAGTYTPFLIVGLRGVWGWSLFGILWTLAALGSLVKIRFGYRYDGLSTIAYVLMGWIGLVDFVPLAHSLPLASTALVLAGGISYTVGAVFYLWDKLPLNHTIWHLFCLAGSVLQFIAVLLLLSL